MLTDCR